MTNSMIRMGRIRLRVTVLSVGTLHVSLRTLIMKDAVGYRLPEESTMDGSCPYVIDLLGN